MDMQRSCAPDITGPQSATPWACYTAGADVFLCVYDLLVLVFTTMGLTVQIFQPSDLQMPKFWVLTCYSWKQQDQTALIQGLMSTEKLYAEKEIQDIIYIYEVYINELILLCYGFHSNSLFTQWTLSENVLKAE